MPKALLYRSFLLRLWVDEGTRNPDQEVAWQVEMESVQSGERLRFSDLAALVAFIEETFPPPEVDARS